MKHTAMITPGKFCEYFGENPQMRILEAYMTTPKEAYSNTELSTITGMNRVTTYRNVRWLVKKRVLASYHKNKRRTSYRLTDHKRVKNYQRIWGLLNT